MDLIYGILIFLVMTIAPAFAQNQPSANDIVLKMQHDLNLSDDQVTNITQIVQRYVDASDDLQKSIDNGTINPSAVQSQQQQLKAVEEEGISQYLRPDQLYEWNLIQSQMERHSKPSDNDSASSADDYSNLPSPGHE